MMQDAKLVVLSGRQKKQQRIIERGYMLPAETGDNPELLGVVPILGAVAAALPSGITLISDIWDKISGKGDTSELIQAQMIQQQQQAAQFNKIMLVAGVGVAAIMMFAIISQRKK
jgi:hypothetical protein